jgi:hypothetical protein
LPEAVLCEDITLSFGEVFLGRGADVRNTPVVTLYGNVRTEPGDGRGAIELWEGPVDVPPDCCTEQDDYDGGSPKDESQDGAQRGFHLVFTEIPV